MRGFGYKGYYYCGDLVLKDITMFLNTIIFHHIINLCRTLSY